MPTTSSGMYWDSRGHEDDPAILLLEGYTGQLLGWRDEFCDLLVADGFRVIRMDNRDIGLSRHEAAGATYTIADMAGDVVDVLRDAQVTRATIVGQSMGGMIAQHVALDHPEVVDAVVLFYTTPTREIIPSDALQPDFIVPRTREEAIEAFIEANRATASPAYEYDEKAQRTLAGLMWDRDPDQSGISRQRHAVDNFADLRSRLHELAMPVALIHGRDDALIPPRGSLEITEKVAHAELHLYPGMGHEIAAPLWTAFTSIIARTASRASTRGVASPR